jgi:hypothetical protein
LAAADGCSLGRAQELLRGSSRDFSEFFAEELEILYDVVHAAIDGEVDEVQLIGRGTRFPFVVDFIKSIVGYTDVLKDLPTTEAIVLGTAHVMQSALNQSRVKLVPVVKPPVYTSSVQCGAATKEYCRHRGKCSDHVMIESPCDDVRIVARPAEVPDGAGDLLARYTFTNLSDFKHVSPISGLLVMNVPAPVVTSAMWCEQGKRRCEVIGVESKKWHDPTFKRKEDFVEAVVQADDNRLKKSEFVARMTTVIEQAAEAALLDPDDELVEMLKQAEKVVSRQVDMTVPEMRQFLIKLEKKVKGMGVEL